MKNFFSKLFKRKGSYIGFGFSSQWKDGEVIIGPRLIESPAGRAGIRNGDVLLIYNDEPMRFASGEEYLAAFKRLRPRAVGDYAHIVVRRGKEKLIFKIYAEMTPPIPVYRFPNIPDSERHLYNLGIAVCKLTGEWVPTIRLSDEALDDVLARH